MYFITAIFKFKRLECVGIKFVQKSALSSASKLGIKQHKYLPGDLIAVFVSYVRIIPVHNPN
jgi:hypothetical protein